MEQFIDAEAVAFGETRNPYWDRWVRRVIAPEMTLAVFEQDRVVATLAALPRELAVPGSSCPTAAITAVGVLPTHRRRGLLRRLMAEQLHRGRAEGLALAILWASEGGIYGRFGFAPATRRLQLSLAAPAKLEAAPPEAGALRLVPRDEALRLLPGIYERGLAGRPGWLRRDQTQWELALAEGDPHLPLSEARRFVALHGTPPDGYLVYRVRQGESQAMASNTVLVEELVADGPAPIAALWHLATQLDLTRRVEARNRPLDDPLLWLAADAQGLELVNRAGIWARILDVPMALETRRYQADGELVLEVLDESLPEVGGRFRLQVREGTARCVPSRAEPELRLELAQLSGGYLGLPHFAAQARAGRLSELAPGAARRLDQLLGWDPPPWCLDEF